MTETKTQGAAVVIRDLTVRAGERYFAQDPTAAGTWLAGSSLSPEARKRLLAKVE